MASTVLQYIGLKIRDIRKSKGFTQEQLAEKADTHHSYVGGLERGERNATIQSLEKIAQALEVDFFELLEYGSGLSDPSIKREMIGKILQLLMEFDEVELKRTYNVLLEIYRR